MRTMSVQTVAVPLQVGRLATLVASRFVLNTIFRIVYPLVPFLALHFGVTQATASTLITVQVSLGLISLSAGWFGDRIGYRRTMVFGLGCTLIGVLGVVAAPTFGWLLLAYGLCGVGGALYYPAMQTYLSAISTYEQRGRAIGVVELSWALAGLVAIPPLLRMIKAQDSLQGVFGLLAIGVVAVLAATLMLLPDEYAAVGTAPVVRTSMLEVLRQPVVFALCTFLFLAIGGNELLYVAQASWATERFNASTADLGTAVLVFGIGELGGSLLSTLFTDRLGKRRAVLLGFSLAALVYLLLPIISSTWAGYLGAYALYGITFEFAIVAAITLASTVSAHSRGTVLALTIVSIQIGRTLGASAAVPLLNAGSIIANSMVAALVVALGVWVAWRGVKERMH